MLGRRYPVATRPLARLLGLALLPPERAGPGLLIPRCRSVHTLGMRFALDLVFLDGRGQVVAIRRAVPPRRLVIEWAARTVLELPAPVGAEAEGPSGYPLASGPARGA